MPLEFDADFETRMSQVRLTLSIMPLRLPQKQHSHAGACCWSISYLLTLGG